jgi:hypothetical protein
MIGRKQHKEIWFLVSSSITSNGWAFSAQRRSLIALAWVLFACLASSKDQVKADVDRYYVVPRSCPATNGATRHNKTKELSQLRSIRRERANIKGRLGQNLPY